ncbi:MAG: hypothetical protein KHZ15_13115 [Coprobacillus cateniformis]|uniref:hypothetical protein n=1 Tax=Longibaculum muris TaxID=1796628 RepID=UPI003AB5F35C|nr:hypothetical protein [Coprobacillus cateniformis]
MAEHLATAKETPKIAFLVIIITITAMVISIVIARYVNPQTLTYKTFGMTYVTMNNSFYEIINNKIQKSW